MAVTIKWRVERALVLETASKLVERGLVLGKAGNVSQRVNRSDEPDLLIITPTSRYYDSLSPADIPVVDLNGRVVDGELAPSSELRLHISVYKARPDVNAVVHSHPVHASALAVAGLGIPPILEEEVALLGGEVRIAQYGPSGSEELARNVVNSLGDTNAVILANHGAVGVGRTLREAFDSCELVEKAARVYLLALSTGGANPLSSEAIAAARKTFQVLRGLR
jgi:ribulose-5-phosphate 4-epimerase/fuculose-1-phosphate aldolase